MTLAFLPNLRMFLAEEIAFALETPFVEPKYFCPLMFLKYERGSFLLKDFKVGFIFEDVAHDGREGLARPDVVNHNGVNPGPYC